MTKSYEKAVEYLQMDIWTNCSMLQLLQRGSAEILHAEKSGVLLRDTVCGGYFLSARASDKVIGWMRKLPCCGLLFLTDPALIPPMQTIYSLPRQIECRQYVYESSRQIVYSPRLRIVPPTPEELAMVKERYHLLTAEEIDAVNARGELYIGHDEAGNPVGMAGSHLEGSMGLLEVFPACRGQGFAMELESFLINRSLARGLTPFCQVTEGNEASHRLQEKLGLCPSDRSVFFLY